VGSGLDVDLALSEGRSRVLIEGGHVLVKVWSGAVWGEFVPPARKVVRGGTGREEDPVDLLEGDGDHDLEEHVEEHVHQEGFFSRHPIRVHFTVTHAHCIVHADHGRVGGTVLGGEELDGHSPVEGTHDHHQVADEKRHHSRVDEGVGENRQDTTFSDTTLARALLRGRHGVSVALGTVTESETSLLVGVVLRVGEEGDRNLDELEKGNSGEQEADRRMSKLKRGRLLGMKVKQDRKNDPHHGHESGKARSREKAEHVKDLDEATEREPTRHDEVLDV